MVLRRKYGNVYREIGETRTANLKGVGKTNNCYNNENKQKR